MEMIFCPPGTFMMGSPTTEAGRGGNETQHQVTLTNGFYLGKYEVTQAQYQTVMNGNPEGLSADPSNFKESNRPVDSVSWGGCPSLSEPLKFHRADLPVDCPTGGNMSCLLRRSGSMPAGQALTYGILVG